MTGILKRTSVINRLHYLSTKQCVQKFNSESVSPTVIDDDTEFRKLELVKKIAQRKPREKLHVPMYPPRYTKMPVDQDWPSVWPTAHTFKPSAVPIPFRQGIVEKGAPPGKFGNLELVKIPNFLHLTPPAIKKHCAAIKKFCTAWPEGLETYQKCEEHFPIEVISSDYCHSGPSIRDPRSRIVTLKIKLKNLDLDYHAKDKLLRLVGDRYNQKTDVITLVADRCPLKKQNYEYIHYVMTALYHESWRVEGWESSKSEADMEKYVWDGSVSEKTIAEMVKCVLEGDKERDNIPRWIKDLPENYGRETIANTSQVQNYAKSATRLHNEGETMETLEEYKMNVKKLLGLENVAVGSSL